MVKEVFAKAEEVKKKLKEKFEQQEIQRREEEVGCIFKSRRNLTRTQFFIIFQKSAHFVNYAVLAVIHVHINVSLEDRCPLWMRM